MPESPPIFICYAREDKSPAEDLYRVLRQAGLSPWMDVPPFPYNKEGIPPGADWDATIRAKIKEALLVFACFSRQSVDKEGYYQRELRIALDRMAQMPPGRIFLVPVLLESCTPRDISVDTVTLGSKQWYHYYRDGVDGLVDLAAKIQEAQKPQAVKEIPRLPADSESPMQTEEEALVLTQRVTKLQAAVVEAAGTYSRGLTDFHEKFAGISEKFRILAATNPPSIRRQSKALAKEAAALIKHQNQSEINGRLAMGQNFAALEETHQKLFAALSDWQWVDADVIERQRPRIAELRALLQDLLSKNEDLIKEIGAWKRFTTEHNRAKRLRREELKRFGSEVLIWLESLDRSEATLEQALEYVTD